jgi:hypothetical protein
VVAVRASEMKYEIAPEGARDYAPLLGIFGLVAYVYNRATLNAPQLLKFVAWYQVLVAAIAVRTHAGRCTAGSTTHLQSTASCYPPSGAAGTAHAQAAPGASRSRALPTERSCVFAAPASRYPRWCGLAVAHSLSLTQLVTIFAQLLFRRAELDNLSSVVAPAILAVYSLNLQQITYMDAAIAMFGCAPC